MGAVGTDKMAYEDYPTDVNDTLIVNRDGKNYIEKYTDQELDVYDHELEMNHTQLLSYKYSHGVYKLIDEALADISLDDIFNYLKKEFNLKV